MTTSWTCLTYRLRLSEELDVGVHPRIIGGDESLCLHTRLLGTYHIIVSFPRCFIIEELLANVGRLRFGEDGLLILAYEEHINAIQKVLMDIDPSLRLISQSNRIDQISDLKLSLKDFSEEIMSTASRKLEETDIEFKSQYRVQRQPGTVSRIKNQEFGAMDSESSITRGWNIVSYVAPEPLAHSDSTGSIVSEEIEEDQRHFRIIILDSPDEDLDLKLFASLLEKSLDYKIRTLIFSDRFFDQVQTTFEQKLELTLKKADYGEVWRQALVEKAAKASIRKHLITKFSLSFDVAEIDHKAYVIEME